MSFEHADYLIIGGGFYGCSLAIFLKQANKDSRIVVFERESEILSRASFNNQARIHGGYHYPRSILTAARSRHNYEPFRSMYADSVVDTFKHFYGISSTGSNVDSRQFRTFCERINAPLTPAPKDVRNLFSPALIEDVFEVEESVFDAAKLREHLNSLMRELKIEVHLKTEIFRIRENDRSLNADYSRISGEQGSIRAGRVFCCIYSRTHKLLENSTLPPIPLFNELAELALVDVPSPIKDKAFTVMCGPFFSVVPFPALGLHSLSHVRYTPHVSWNASGEVESPLKEGDAIRARSKYKFMINDASRFMPVLEDCVYRDSLWEVKTTLPRSTENDSRPILIRQDHGLKGFCCIVGGKIDNICDMVDELSPEKIDNGE